MNYEVRKRIFRIVVVCAPYFLFYYFIAALLIHAQPVTPNHSVTRSSEPIYATPYYRIAGLGSAKGDSAGKFPYPIVILQVLDTMRTWIVVRFPELGVLGVAEDTVTQPAFKTNDTLLGYRPQEPLYLLTFPKTKYFVFIDVWSRNAGHNARPALLDSRPFEYDMNVEAYKSGRLRYIHEPATGMGSPTLRRRFKPALLPFSLETNPGWVSTETLDSSATYTLFFRDPRNPEILELSLTMRPAIVGIIDSATWRAFKSKAEIAFGEKGIATSSIGDFEVKDSAARRIIKGGFEFISKNSDSTIDYVAAFLTSRAILLLLAPIDDPNQKLQVEYFQAIARSLKLE